MRLFIILLAGGLIAAGAVGVSAQEAEPKADPPRDPFDVNWWTFDGGGGPAAGGGYELLATIGQADVGNAIGGDYVLMAGFLSGGDLGILFVDGFENGTTDRWDSTVGGVIW